VYVIELFFELFIKFISFFDVHLRFCVSFVDLFSQRGDLLVESCDLVCFLLFCQESSSLGAGIIDLWFSN
jgi:hypothetical protein